jgi:hypothetical protein
VWVIQVAMLTSIIVVIKRVILMAFPSAFLCDYGWLISNDTLRHNALTTTTVPRQRRKRDYSVYRAVRTSGYDQPNGLGSVCWVDVTDQVTFNCVLSSTH